MKKSLSICVFGLAILGFASCSKTEVMDNSGNDMVSAARRAPEAAATVYGGSATALNATITTIENGMVTSNQSLVANTGLLASNGGSLSVTEPQVNLQGIVTAEGLSASISGLANKTDAQSSVTSLNLAVNGHTISAGSITSTATSVCGAVSGSSSVSGLVVNGTPIVVTGAPNQVVFLQGGGFIMINEQSTTKKGKVNTMYVTALRIVIPNKADVRVAALKTEIKC